MSSPPGGRLHLWFWVVVGVLLYVASCPPVEAWHERQQYANTHPRVGVSSPTVRAPGHSEDFEILHMDFITPPPQPKWMQVLYAPVHFVEQYPPFAAILQQYRAWCEALFSSGS